MFDTAPGAACVYGFYREQYDHVSSVQNHMMSEFKKSMYYEVLHGGDTVVWSAKTFIFKCQ